MLQCSNYTTSFQSMQARLQFAAEIARNPEINRNELGLQGRGQQLGRRDGQDD